MDGRGGAVQGDGDGVNLLSGQRVGQSDHREDLPRLRVPTLVVQSTGDLVVPMSVGEYMAKKIPHAEYLAIEASGHFPHASAPEATSQAIRSFFG